MDIQMLVGRAQAGEREAFSELYEQLSSKVYSYLYYHLNGRTHLAENLTEAVFVKVLDKLSGYRDRGLPFSAWVFRIAHNELIQYVRAEPRRAVKSIDTRREQPAQRSQERPRLALTHSELAIAFSGLSHEQKRVVVLRFLQGLNTAETAQVLGKTQDAVKRLQARGLQALRRQLQDTAHALAVA